MCTHPYFWECVENESVAVFYKDVWGNAINICKENRFKGIFVGYGVMFVDFSYEGTNPQLILKYVFSYVFKDSIA